MNSDTFVEICRILKKKYKDIKIYDTLCNSPIKIQESAIKLAKKVDAMIVVGDKLSANTTTLFEKVKNIKPTYFIETKNDINLKEIEEFKSIGITGGSSTPDWQMSEIKEFLEANIK
jgi:4-hydroxy-3-methylbut-2-enyl diphosphate reductase